MAKAAQKISLNSSRDIPLDKLVLSQSNIRRLKAGVSIEELAEDIARRGLLQSLHVRPVLDADGGETGMFEIPAGGRRYRALQLLVKQKRMTKTQAVPCIVKEDGLAEEDSLAENLCREALHPLDQFRAFQELREKGLSEDDIAARFFVTPTIVKQRLRLAGVSPKLLAIYGDDGMSLEQLTAFSVTTDQLRQEQVWQNVSRSYNKDPWSIRRQLTQNTVPSNDRRAIFIGLGAYEAADGYVLRDLFSQDGDGWLQDVVLLERLVTEKLKIEAEKTADEGWKWIEVAFDFPYGHADGLRQIDGEPQEMTTKERKTYAALKAEYDKLEAQYEDADELPDEIDQRLGQIETALQAFDARPRVYDPADIARAGVFISIDPDGDLLVERGYVRAEDETSPQTSDDVDDNTDASEDGAPAGATRRTIVTVAGEEADDDEEDGVKPLPDRLIAELTAYRTLALRDALAGNPHVALTALLHRLCTDAFLSSLGGKCLEVSVQRVSFPAQTPELKQCAATQAISTRHDAWRADMPKDEDALWDWIAALDNGSRASLLAHCVSLSVNALYERGDRYGAGPSQNTVSRRLAQADRLSAAVGLDMIEAGWRPTVDNYLGRVPKARILEAVREGKDEQSAQLIDHLKKAEMAKEAERLLGDSGWLPEPLRRRDAGASDTTLPAFLADDASTGAAHTA